MWNPPSTGFIRPAERKFFIWRHPFLSTEPWLWMCTLCDPPSRGWRSQPDAFRKIIEISMPHHFRVRHQHHKWVRRHRPVMTQGRPE